MFTGFPSEAFSFFAALRFNNNKAFFEENRATYEQCVRAPLFALAEALAPVAHAIDPLLDTRPGRAVSRIHRDVRFSKDKSPFRDYMWIGFRRVGESREETCGFYFDISDAEAHWGCGFYHVGQEVMQRLRDAMLERPGRVLEAIEAPDFRKAYSLMGEQYARQYQPPESLAEPLKPLFSKKNLYAEHRLEDMGALGSPDLSERIARDFRAAEPFYTLLRECMTKREES